MENSEAPLFSGAWVPGVSFFVISDSSENQPASIQSIPEVLPVRRAAALLVVWLGAAGDHGGQLVAPFLGDGPLDLGRPLAVEIIEIILDGIAQADLTVVQGLDVLVAHDAAGDRGDSGEAFRSFGVGPAFAACYHSASGVNFSPTVFAGLDPLAIGR
jgi:hypothetical protein